MTAVVLGRRAHAAMAVAGLADDPDVRAYAALYYLWLREEPITARGIASIANDVSMQEASAVVEKLRGRRPKLAPWAPYAVGVCGWPFSFPDREWVEARQAAIADGTGWIDLPAE